jgi:hypothetical protein
MQAPTFRVRATSSRLDFPKLFLCLGAFVEFGFEENTTTDLSHFVFFALGFSTSNNPSS